MANKKRPATSGTRKGNGRGYGGAAKGPGSGKPRHYFDKAGPGRGHYSKEGEARFERQARHAEEMKELLYGLASDPITDDGTRVQAAEKLLNRLEGLPVQRVVTAETDPISMLNDQQLDDEIERTRAKATKLRELREADEAGGGPSTPSP